MSLDKMADPLVKTLLRRADAVLRRHASVMLAPHTSIASLVSLIAIFGSLYGAVMGCYGATPGPAAWQILFSAVKVPLLLLATFALSLPSFFVASSLLGLRSDFAAAIRALLATQAGLAMILASLAPFTLLWYASVGSYSAAVAFNAVMFAIASVSAQWILRGYFQPLIQRNPRHRWILRVWIVVYAFIGIQMGWVLRPFIGDPYSLIQFFRSESWGNAYVVVFRLFWRILSG
jgi:hypothetical protein